MFARLDIEAFLTDADLADQVWGLWDAGLISDELAAIAWQICASPCLQQSHPANFVDG